MLRTNAINILVQEYAKSTIISRRLKEVIRGSLLD
jgi:hypothetical protein